MDNKKKILIVDDSKPIRAILRYTLKQEGYDPTLAENGRRGLDTLFDDNNEFDLIILDVMMPQLNGYEVLERIRTSNNPKSKTPVIMLTAKAQKEDVLKGVGKGANDYVVKPYKFVDLLGKIKKLIG